MVVSLFQSVSRENPKDLTLVVKELNNSDERYDYEDEEDYQSCDKFDIFSVFPILSNTRRRELISSKSVNPFWFVKVPHFLIFLWSDIKTNYRTKIKKVKFCNGSIDM